MKNLTKFIDKCLEDASERLEGGPFKMDEMELYSWPQVWGDTSCGMGGYAGQMMCSSQVCIIGGANDRVGVGRDRCVYSSGGLLYHIHHPSDDFWKAFSNHSTPARFHRQKLEKSPCPTDST